jgi:integrase
LDLRQAAEALGVTREAVRRRAKPGTGLPDIRFHDLRHTFATLTLAKGANVKPVSKMLGHSSIRVTLDVYAHIMPGMQSDALKTLDGLFS